MSETEDTKPTQTPETSPDQSVPNTFLSIKSTKLTVTIPEEMEEQLLLIGAALGCKGKSDIIATALRVLINATHGMVNSWIQRKSLQHNLSYKEVVEQALDLYKS